jgi:DNA primase
MVSYVLLVAFVVMQSLLSESVRELAISMPSNSTKKLLEKATAHYQEELFNDESALTYLVKRGLTRETVESFRLGLVKNPPPETGHDFQIDRLAIPYITQTGIVQVRFRALPYDGIPGNPEPSPKMKGESGAKGTIYNARQLLDSTEIIAVCEGEFDTMSAVQSGIPAIGIAGANAWQPVYGRVLRWRKVIVLADNDDHGEGMKFAETVQASTRARIKLMPKGHDVNSFLVEFGEEKLRELVLK